MLIIPFFLTPKDYCKKWCLVCENYLKSAKRGKMASAFCKLTVVEALCLVLFSKLMNKSNVNKMIIILMFVEKVTMSRRVQMIMNICLNCLRVKALK